MLIMPPHLGTEGIMFSGCPSVRPSVRPTDRPLTDYPSDRPTVGQPDPRGFRTFSRDGIGIVFIEVNTDLYMA